MRNSPWNNRLDLFRGTLNRIVVNLGFRTPHELNTVANILEQKAQFLRYEADELLSKTAEVQTECRCFERSASLIESDRGRLSSIAVE